MDYVLNILCNILASIAFLFIVLYTLRPTIRICDKISKQRNTFNDTPPTDHTYVFKFVNRSWHSSFDINLELFVLEEYRATAKGRNRRMKPITLKRNHIKHVPSFSYDRSSKKRESAPHAILFRTNENLEEILTAQEKTLQLQVTLRHGLSGLSRVYHKDYINISDVKQGVFKFGNSTEIE